MMIEFCGLLYQLRPKAHNAQEFDSTDEKSAVDGQYTYIAEFVFRWDNRKESDFRRTRKQLKALGVND